MSRTASRYFSRRCGARLVAGLGTVLAVSWGPLSHTLKLLEVHERGERSVRVVFASDYSLEQSQKNSGHAKRDSAATDSKSGDSRTERLLNAAPDTLEAAHAIHFELNAAPVAPEIISYIGSAEARHASYVPILAVPPPPDSTLARGPPLV